MDGTLRLASRFAEARPLEAARRLETVAAADAATLLAHLVPQTAAAVLGQMLPAFAAELVAQMEPDVWVAVVPLLSTQRLVAMLRHLRAEDRSRLLGSLEDPVSTRLSRLLDYPDGTVGAAMDPSVVPMPQDMTVDEARGVTSDHRVPYLYVVDRDQKLVGVVHRRELASAASGTALSSIITTQVVRIPASATLVAITEHDLWQEFEAMPVVDAAGRYLGTIRHKDLRARRRRPQPTDGQRSALATALDLGELYWTGLSSLVDSLASTPSSDPRGEESNA